MLRWIQTLLIACAVVVAAFVGFRYVRSQMAADVYRQRLAAVSRDYKNLRQMYNQAVQKTAVTELVVQDNTLCVNIRNAQGVQRTIPTPFDPSREIYVDYVVLDGRLWIRRVFDQDTPPGKGVLINPDHLKVDWADSPQAHGKAVYRSLSEGRWLITVTGDGSLGLAKATGPTPPLAEAPPIRGYEPLTDPLPDQTQPLGAADVVKRLINPNSP